MKIPRKALFKENLCQFKDTKLECDCDYCKLAKLLPDR